MLSWLGATLVPIQLIATFRGAGCGLDVTRAARGNLNSFQN